MTSGFTILASEAKSIAAGADFLTDDVDFSPTSSDDTENRAPTPPNIMREIQIQFFISDDAIVDVTVDAGTTWIPINNADTVNGLVTLTIFADSDTQLNLRHTATSTLSVKTWIGG